MYVCACAPSDPLLRVIKHIKHFEIGEGCSMEEDLVSLPDVTERGGEMLRVIAPSEVGSEYTLPGDGQCMCKYTTYEQQKLATVQLLIPESRGDAPVISGMVFMDAVPVFTELNAQLHVGSGTLGARLFFVTDEVQEKFVVGLSGDALLETDPIVLAERGIVCSEIAATGQYATLRFSGEPVEARHCAVIVRRKLAGSGGGLSSKDLEQDIEDFRSVISVATGTGSEGGGKERLDALRITVRLSKLVVSAPEGLCPVGAAAVAKRLREVADESDGGVEEAVSLRTTGRGRGRGGRRRGGKW